MKNKFNYYWFQQLLVTLSENYENDTDLNTDLFYYLSDMIISLTDTNDNYFPLMSGYYLISGASAIAKGETITIDGEDIEPEYTYITDNINGGDLQVYDPEITHERILSDIKYYDLTDAEIVTAIYDAIKIANKILADD